MLSVNTNYGAMTALQNLSLASNEKQQIQSRINTGLKVGSVTDNGAIWAIAKGITSDVVDTSVNITQLDQTKSVLDVTLSALDSISDLMIEMKEKALALTDESMTFDQLMAFQEDYTALFDQAQTIARNATFNDLNLLDGSTLTLTPTSLSAIDGFDLADILQNGITRTGDVSGIFGGYGGTVTGNFSGIVNGNLDAVVYGDASGVINGDINGDIYGDFDGVVNGNINGDIYGTFSGVLNGAFNGSQFNGSVPAPQEITIEAADEVPAAYMGRTYSGVEGYVDDPMFPMISKDELLWHYSSMAGKIENTISGLANYASKLGTMSKAVDTQTQFLQVKQDTLLANRGNLVDADMAKESARLNAIQTKEQLGVQALSIANQAPSIMLRLFG